MRLRVPGEEIGEDLQADLLAFFGVELGAGAVGGGDHGDDGGAVVGGGDDLFRVAAGEGVGVDEIGMVAGDEAVEERVGAGGEEQIIPAHVGQAEGFCGEERDFAFDPAEAWGGFVFEAALGHELHADADTEERRACIHAGGERLFEAVEAGEAGGAIREGALAGEDDAVGFGDEIRVRGDFDGGVNAASFGGDGEAAGGGGQVAAGVVNDADEQLQAAFGGGDFCAGARVYGGGHFQGARH